jgi:tRNA G10  N-methylase Trm11
MGTICAEAAMRGVNVIGSDSDKETIEKAQKNMSWLLSRYRLSSSIRLLHADATHIDEIIDKKTIDAIVTEPFLGSSRIGKDEQINRNKLQKIIKGLEKLYIGSLKCWTLILKSRGIVVIAFPEYAVNTGTYGVKKVIDRCETLGYTKVLGPIAYSRPQAKVKRLFFVFQKKI